jgi:DNA-binding response OmpR family regulator
MYAIEYGVNMGRIRLLLVDDEDDFRTALAGSLRERGFEVTDVQSGYRAIEEVKTGKIDVAILDRRMPGMDGCETLRQMKSIDSTIEVIMLTGQAPSESGREGMRLGAFDYVAKPCDIDALVLRINAAYLKRQGQADRSARPPSKVPPDSS